ncbi:MAG TPA: hypothetical protein VFS43_08665 [Polyangiaceae bacterium]|nr:hypothetical protein [Polyangiaceae bacterium]
MERLNLVLTITYGSVVATSLGIEGLARHLSPGSGKHFEGRAIFADLALAPGGAAAAFSYLDEGGWRDAAGDTARALQGVLGGKRTKTALSNGGFNITPLDAYRGVYLVKTGGQILSMAPASELTRWASGDCDDSMGPGEIARAIGAPEPAQRVPRLYAVLAPIELLVLSNLTPVEYAWYATHRPGKVFRQVCFAELSADQTGLAASSRYENGRREIEANPQKKTKTVAVQSLLNSVPFEDWVGYGGAEAGGLYFSDRSHMLRVGFPREVPFAWERAELERARATGRAPPPFTPPRPAP